MSDITPLVPETPSHFTCGSCMYCNVGPKTSQDVLSRVCHRNPPIPFAFLTQQGILVVSARGEIRTDTPACGEFDDGGEE